MNTDDLTIKQARELTTMFARPNSESHSIPIGAKVIIRTVTMIFTGKIRNVTDYDILLDDAAWIADTARWANCLKDGTLNEVEPYPSWVLVSRAGVIDISPWNHDLPRTQK